MKSGLARGSGRQRKPWGRTLIIENRRNAVDVCLMTKAEEVIRFRADPELEARIEELVGKSTVGELTEHGRAEYAGICVRISSSPFSNDKHSSSRIRSHR